ncbi:MAG: flippase activity-associated protein Agl23, partial [Dehalococcoidia bacterium]
MASIAREPELRLGESRRSLERLLSFELSVNAEVLAYAGLVALAIVLHFWDLGSRALHHDESLHATYSYYLYRGQGYKHDPLMHGPILFHLTALMYFIFGASDATSRFSAALAGTALVFLPYFLRHWIGRWGALAASAMLIFSPTALYYSRLIREDIFVAVWTAGLFISVWGYSRGRQNRWLYLAAGCLALGFANKEITFMLAAILLVYTDVLLAADLTAAVGSRQSAVGRDALFLLLIPVAWVIAVLWYPLRGLRRRFGLRELPASGDLLVVLGTLTLPQLGALIQIPLKHLGYNLSDQSVAFSAIFPSGGELVADVTVLTLLALAAMAGILWDRKRWLISVAVFYGIYFCLFTTFFTNVDGFGSGIWNSLHYWLAQQDVKRGGQPVFYYLMVLPAYEYVALSFAAIGIVLQVTRQGALSRLLFLCSVALMPAITAVYGLHLRLAGHTLENVSAAPLVVACLAFGVAALRGNPLRQLLLFWFGALLFGLSVAGEKMPWLSLHLALPVILLAGMAIDDLLSGALSMTSAIERRRRLSLLSIAVMLGVAIVIPVAWGPGSDAKHAVIMGIALAVVLLTFIIAALTWSRLRSDTPAARGSSSTQGKASSLLPTSHTLLPRGRLAASLAGALLLGLLVPLSIRSSLALSFVRGDTPYDMLVYTQTSPDIPRIMRDIDQYAKQSGQGYNLPIVVDANDAFTWPWAWYLRDYHQVSYIDFSSITSGQGSAYKPAARSILLLNNFDRGTAAQFPGQFGAGVPYHHRWWFPEDYRGTTAPSFARSLTRAKTWATWWGLIVGEHGIVRPETPPAPGQHVIGSVDAVAFFPADYKPGEAIMASTSAPAAPRTDPNGGLTIGGTGSGPGAFLRPAGVAIDDVGDIYVADSQNNRIQKFDRNGKLLATSVNSNGQPGFLKEPWGVALDRQGMVYVADTWDHRIVKLDPQLRYVATWGYPIKASGPDSLLSLYGPRAIAFEPSGNLLVTDTGNSRVIEYSPGGQPLGSFGSYGVGAGQLQEPVGLAVAPDGTIYV